MKPRYLLLVIVTSVAFAANALAAAQEEKPTKDTPQVGDTPQAHSSPTTPEEDTRIVRRVEQELQEAGYDVGSIDGEWDDTTKTAVTEFQKAEGLNATGLLDEDTLRVLGIDP